MGVGSMFLFLEPRRECEVIHERDWTVCFGFLCGREGRKRHGDKAQRLDSEAAWYDWAAGDGDWMGTDGLEGCKCTATLLQGTSAGWQMNENKNREAISMSCV